MERLPDSPRGPGLIRHQGATSYFLVGLAGSLAGMLLMWTLWKDGPESGDKTPGPGGISAFTVATSQGSDALQREPTNEKIAQSRRTAIVAAVERVSPAVVSIVATQLVQQSGYTTFFDDPFFGGLAIPRSFLREMPSTGSGVVVSADGHIVTNAHVVENARRIRAVLTDGRTEECRLVGIDPLADLAVLRIERSGFTYAPLGRSSEAMVGEWVIAIGNPLGLAIEDARPAVTVGVVSATGRNFSREESDSPAIYRDMIQTDASINPGNSGGPLINALGEVIGINTFILSESGGSEGIGFAIPIDRVKRITDDLITHGKPRRGWTGLEVMDITAFVAEEFGIEDDQGVLVSRVVKDSPAARAGIRIIDIIREIDGNTIADSNDAQEALFGRLVGDRVSLGIERNGRRMSLTLQIAER